MAWDDTQTSTDAITYIEWNNMVTYTKSAIDSSDSINVTDLTVDTSTLVVDSANNRVGIGTASPSTVCTISTSVNNGVLLTDGTTNGIVFASSTLTNSLAIGTTTNHPLIFGTNNSFPKLTIGTDGSLTALDVYSDTVGGTNRDLYIDDTGLIGYVSSSQRYKKNIVDMSDAEWIYDLNCVTFDYINEETGLNKMGLIAEEVEKVNPNICSYDEDGQIETVNYKELIIPLLKELQTLRARVDQLENKTRKKAKKVTKVNQISRTINKPKENMFDVKEIPKKERDE